MTFQELEKERMKKRNSLAQMAAAFLLVILIYFLEMLMYNIPLNWGRFLIESAAALLLMAAVQGLCILLAATQDWWSRRMGTTARLRRHSKCKVYMPKMIAKSASRFRAALLITVLMAVTAPITDLLMFYTFIRFLFPGRFLQLIILYIEAEQNRIPILYHIILAFHADQAFFPGRCQRALL
ncbi:MAG: hypothetical protein ACLVLH_07315 [Eisenbergiella massiliensis]